MVLIGNVWEFVKKYWYVVLPAFLAVIYLLIFKKKKRPVVKHRRASTGIKKSTTRRKKGRFQRLSGNAFVKKMRLAKLRKARQRK